MTAFLHALATNVLDTAGYLVAYRAVPIVAILAMAASIRFAPRERLRRAGRSGGKAPVAAFLLGASSPGSATVVERELAGFPGPGTLVAFLAGGHGVTPYYLLMLGPLLGKDVLLSHLLGGLFFVVSAAVLGRVIGVRVPEQRAAGADPEDRPEAAGSLLARIRSEGLRAGGSMLVGLVAGGLVAAWGLTGPRPVAAEVVAHRAAAQGINAVLGLALSTAGFMAPVVNLFVGTYLWKAGLAHAGLVTFFWAVTVSPQRIRSYIRVLGPAQGKRLALTLAAAALVAGVAVAGLYHLTPLTIRYKLTPEQMW